MSELARQEDANQKTEAGMFYPTGYIVAAFADRETADQARAKLISKGFGDSEVRHVGAAEMAREAAKNLEHPSFFASIGSSLPTRQKQLELAEHGCDFLLIHAPEDASQNQALETLGSVQTRYAVKYKRLIIENLLQHIPQASGSQPSRVP